jgi:hypothetical protein
MKRFVRYVDSTGEYLPEQYGRCDREVNCGYHLNPYADGYGREDSSYTRTLPLVKAKKPQVLNYIPKSVLKETLQGYENNVFVQNLANRVKYPFPERDLEQVISMYYLGCVNNGYRRGAITFPFIDSEMNVRAIQVKQFNEDNHTTGTDFLHSIIEKHHTKRGEDLPDWLQEYQKNESKVSCLFGEHLLKKYPLNPIALVEAPKTALYGTLYFGFPDSPNSLLWLAVYNLSSLTAEKCGPLHGRRVILFPDLSENGRAFQLWSEKANSFRIPGAKFIVSDLLENHAGEVERAKGLDLADYLIERDWRKFRKMEDPLPKSEKSEKREPVKTKYFLPETSIHEKHENNVAPKQTLFSEKWEVEELEAFFKNRILPIDPIRLNQCEVITDVKKFIDSHLCIVKSNNGKIVFKPYFERLLKLKEILN